MILFHFPTWMMVFAVAAIVLIALAVSRQRKRDEKRWDVKICPKCGANNPPHATHCRACGTKVQG